MRNLAIAFACAAALATLSQPARSCTLTARVPPPTRAEIDEATRQLFAGAEAVVEVVAVRGSSFGRTGQMRIVRTYKRALTPGELIALRPLPDSLCGAGDFAAGSRGLIALPRMFGELVFQGYLSAEQVATLQRSRLLTPPPDR